jgi:exonuclease I
MRSRIICTNEVWDAVPFIVYDTETTGLNTAFDQILRFAAILADDNLRELETFALW